MTEFERGLRAAARWLRNRHKRVVLARYLEEDISTIVGMIPAGDREAVTLRAAAINARAVLRGVISRGARKQIGTLYSQANQAAWRLSEALDHAPPAHPAEEEAVIDAAMAVYRAPEGEDMFALNKLWDACFDLSRARTGSEAQNG